MDKNAANPEAKSELDDNVLSEFQSDDFRRRFDQAVGGEATKVDEATLMLQQMAMELKAADKESEASEACRQQERQRAETHTEDSPRDFSEREHGMMQALMALEAKLESSEAEKVELMDDMEHVLLQRAVQSTANDMAESCSTKLFAVRAMRNTVGRVLGVSVRLHRCWNNWQRNVVVFSRESKEELEMSVVFAIEQGEEAMEVAAAQMNALSEVEDHAEQLQQCCSVLGEWLVELCEVSQVQEVHAVPVSVIEWLAAADLSVIPHAARLKELVQARPLA